MKKLLLFLSVVALMVACDKENNGRLDPNAMISLRAAKNITPASRAEGHLSALEIVKKTNDMCFYNAAVNGETQISRGFAVAQRDLVNERLLMWGDDIVSSETGALVEVFIGGTDVVLRRATHIPFIGNVDTIAYIPNATLRAAEKAVRAAYAKEDYTAVYKLFDEAYRFIPITGDEWRELKRQGVE